ncbi:MAG: hypothetical protein ACLFPV_08225 [Spirochaetaceae bacterium]
MATIVQERKSYAGVAHRIANNQVARFIASHIVVPGNLRIIESGDIDKNY